MYYELKETSVKLQEATAELNHFVKDTEVVIGAIDVWCFDGVESWFDVENVELNGHVGATEVQWRDVQGAAAAIDKLPVPVGGSIAEGLGKLKDVARPSTAALDQSAKSLASLATAALFYRGSEEPEEIKAIEAFNFLFSSTVSFPPIFLMSDDTVLSSFVQNLKLFQIFVSFLTSFVMFLV